MGITLDSNLHGETSVEDDGYQTLNRHDLSESSKSRVLSKRVTSKAAVSLDKSLCSHILETGLLHESQRRLGKLSGRQQASWRSVGVGGCSLINLLEDLLRLDRAIGCNSLERHGHVICTDGLATRTAEVDGKLLRVVLDDVGDFKACFRLDKIIS